MTVKELVADLIGCNADSNVVLEDDVEFTDEYGKVSGSCYQIEKVIKHGRSVSLHFDNRQHFMREQEPKIGHCKDCKWWKDSDGMYRRGCGAESKCPINRRKVFDGKGYCYLFEPQESEGEE